jgi:hypothetical protein
MKGGRGPQGPGRASRSDVSILVVVDEGRKAAALAAGLTDFQVSILVVVDEGRKAHFHHNLRCDEELLRNLDDLKCLIRGLRYRTWQRVWAVRRKFDRS